PGAWPLALNDRGLAHCVVLAARRQFHSWRRIAELLGEPRVRLGGSVITYPHFGAPLSPACRITFPRMHDPSSADSSVACAACAHQHPKTRRSVSLLTRPMERRPLSAFPRGGGRAHLSGTNDACLDHPSARRRAHRRLPAAPLAALGLTAAACGAARRPRLRRRSAASRCAGTGVTRPKQEETLRGFKTSRHDAFRKTPGGGPPIGAERGLTLPPMATVQADKRKPPCF